MNIKTFKKLKEQYIAGDRGRKCPVCGSYELEDLQYQITRSGEPPFEIMVQIECMRCETVFREYYRLQDIEFEQQDGKGGIDASEVHMYPWIDTAMDEWKETREKDNG